MPKIIQVRNFYSILNDEWRVLNAVEIGMVDHEYVPLELVHKYASIKQGGNNFKNVLKNSLVPNRLVAYHGNGYRLTNLGYDFLALHKFIKSNVVSDLSNFQFFATGKESDLYVCNSEQNCQEYDINMKCPIVLKFHRLGRTSFKQVRNKREYKTGNSCSWIYMNRISATREYCTMKALHEANLPVPVPLAHNRGSVAMEYVNSCPLFKFSKYVLENGAADVLYAQGKSLLVKLAEIGLIHGDFNEFNLLVEVDSLGLINKLEERNENEDNSSDDLSEEDESIEDVEQVSDESEDTEEQITEDDEESLEDNENTCPYINQDVNTFKLRMIDFPQVISRDNKAAQEIYARDRHGLINFFGKFKTISDSDLPPEYISEIQRTDYLDIQIKAPGFPRNMKNPTMTNAIETEEGSTKTTITISLNDVKNRISKEKSKATPMPRINKQQRNIKKQECRRDLKSDLFF